MFHEVAHGLGIKNTINGRGSVRKALKEHSGAIEEGKADILGLHMIQQRVWQQSFGNREPNDCEVLQFDTHL